MAVQPIAQFPCVKGLVASNQPLAEPKGAVQRVSNLLMTARGALDVCDGSQILHDFSGAVQASFGKITAIFLFQPTGVSNYYLAIIKVPGSPLSTPLNVVAVDDGAGGNFAAGTLYYRVTALDGVGGETLASTEVSVGVSLNHKIKLTWNVVPNAVAYNVYGYTSGTELLLIAPGLPVPQPAPGATQVTFEDLSTPQSVNFPVTSVVNSSAVFNAVANQTTYTYVVNFTGAQTITAQLPLAATLTGNSNASLNIVYKLTAMLSPTVGLMTVTQSGVVNPAMLVTGNGGNINAVGHIPVANTTQQTALYKMPVIAGLPAPLPVAYNNSNIVAFYPADFLANVDGGGGGGSGGGGGTGGGGSTNPGNTPSGGVAGNTSVIPQFKQFTNRAVIALGNGYPIQLYSDPSTPINPAVSTTISTISADANSVVTVTVLSTAGLYAGGNVAISGVSNSLFNMVGPIIQVVDLTHFTVYNGAVSSTTSSGGKVLATSQPIQSTFAPSYPVWTTTTVYAANDVIVPATQPSPNIYLIAVQGGTSGAAEPIPWPTEIGAQKKDGTVIWAVGGLLNSAAPPPPGAGHIEVYSGALWAWDTSPFNTANGLDGPCALRMSNINNPNSWNPINQAFLDKDDGQEGMGLAKFTITAIGIPPQGSLIAFKNYSSYQVIGIFGASNFAIQAISTDMGCTAPRTIQFVPGFGITRYAHLGMAVFNGVKDEVISEQIRPFLFPNNDFNFSDITVLDAAWVSVSWATQTATPPMYVVAMPIGVSAGNLTRVFCYDLVFKAWIIVDLPFPISTMSQFRTVSANPVTVMGGSNDGCISRWQAGDVLWDTGATGARNPSKVQWNMRTLTIASSTNDQRVYNRRLVVTMICSGTPGSVSVSWRMSGVTQATRTFTLPTNADQDIDVATQLTGKRFDAIISGNSDAQIDGITWEVEPRPIGVVVPI
jgi:hypothetical protein